MTPQQARREAQNLLREAGINPVKILIDGIDETGYLEPLSDAFGSATTRHEWPDGFPVDEFLAAVRRGYGVRS